MIDFRYHLVSLIAVFLALAVGIVLGAGPLRGTIGETLTGQVEELRQDREMLRAELAGAEANVVERTVFLEESADVLLEDVLPGRSIAIVTLPGTDGDHVEVLREELERAGAEVVGEVAVTDAWADPETESFRQSFAGQLIGYLETPPADDASDDTVLGLALGRALTAAGSPGTDGEDAATLLDLFTGTDAPLLRVQQDPTAPADATLLVGPPPVEVPEEEPEPEVVEETEAITATHVSLAAALADAGPSVTAGFALNPGDLVSAVRAADVAVTTVDSLGEITGNIAAPLALAVAISGANDHFGFNIGAERSVPPRVELPGPTPDAGGSSPEDPTGGADPGDTSGTDDTADGSTQEPTGDATETESATEAATESTTEDR